MGCKILDMPTQTFTNNIREEIKARLLLARFDIYIAVAWFTDLQLFNILNQKAKEGVKIRLVLLKHPINANARFDHRDLENVNGDVFFRDHHNKYCIIDRKIVITGSCNWTSTAFNGNNRENIVIIDEETEVGKLVDNFLEIINRQINVQDYDFTDDYKLKFIGSFQRIFDDFSEQDFKFAKPVGVSMSDLWLRRTEIPCFVNIHNTEHKIRVVISEALRNTLNVERENILSLPVYGIIHRNGDLWKGTIILGLESDNGQRYDPTYTL